MKQIELKTIENDDGGKFAYKDVLLAKMRVHPQGITLDDMEKRALPVIAKLKHANKNVLLEDAEHEYLLKRLQLPDWGTADSAIVQLVGDVKNAPTVDVDALLEEKTKSPSCDGGATSA